MDFSSSSFWLSLLQIVWIDLLLSGDNAIVIAMAVRSLPAQQRRLGILPGQQFEQQFIGIKPRQQRVALRQGVATDPMRSFECADISAFGCGGQAISQL